MATTKGATIRNGARVAVVRWDAEWEEFTAKVRGERGTGYHTPDRDDAIATARVMVGLPARVSP